MSGWNFKPNTTEQQAEEARGRNEKLCETTPPTTPSRLNPAAKPFYPLGHRATLAVDNIAIGSNSSPQSTNPSSREGSDTVNSNHTTVAHVTQDDIMGLIKQVTEGDSHQEHICQLFQRFPMLGQLATVQVNPAKPHRQIVSSAQLTPVQHSPKAQSQEGYQLSDKQEPFRQSTSAAVSSCATTPVQPAVSVAASMSSDISALGYRFATMVVCMREEGFELPQIDAALRAADYDPDRALNSLLGSMPDSTKGTNIDSLRDAVLAQASPVRPVATSGGTTKDTSAGHTTTIQSAHGSAAVAPPKAAPTMESITRPCGNPVDFQGVRRSFQRAMLQANTEAALAPRRPLFDRTKHGKNTQEKK